MPLWIEGKVVDTDSCSEYHAAMKAIAPLEDARSRLLYKEDMKGYKDPIQVDDPHGLLYVGQREYAVLTPDDNTFTAMGTDYATTCHMIVLRHTGSNAVCLSHLDGWKTEHCIETLLKEITKPGMSGLPEGRIEVYLCGGFIDDRNESSKLSCEVLKTLASSTHDIHLMLACISKYNDETRLLMGSNIHFPIIYGIGVTLNPFSIKHTNYSAKCKGPDEHIRSAALFGSCKKFEKIYNENDEVVIGPFPWRGWSNIKLWLKASDEQILQNLSTSPEQEPADFPDHVRESLRMIVENPQPMQTLFKNGARRFKQNKSTGEWDLVKD